MMAIYRDPMFWHHVWFGLLQLKKGNLNRAQEVFKDASVRIHSVAPETKQTGFLNLLAGLATITGFSLRKAAMFCVKIEMCLNQLGRR